MAEAELAEDDNVAHVKIAGTELGAFEGAVVDADDAAVGQFDQHIEELAAVHLAYLGDVA